jgi:hypothetical protein
MMEASFLFPENKRRWEKRIPKRGRSPSQRMNEESTDRKTQQLECGCMLPNNPSGNSPAVLARGCASKQASHLLPGMMVARACIFRGTFPLHWDHVVLLKITAGRTHNKGLEITDANTTAMVSGAEQGRKNHDLCIFLILLILYYGKSFFIAIWSLLSKWSFVGEIK